jgi:hypothetical protein
LTAALLQALAQLGVNTNGTSAASTAGSGTTASQDQVTSLVQSLAAALQAQNGTTASPAAAASTTGQSSLASSLQNLIYQVNSSDASALGALFDSSSSSASSDGSDPFSFAGGGASNSSAATSSTSALASLQSNFSSLFGSQSSTPQGSVPSLESFLQSALANVQGATATGNLISTKA